MIFASPIALTIHFKCWEIIYLMLWFKCMFGVNRRLIDNYNKTHILLTIDNNAKHLNIYLSENFIDDDSMLI